MRYMVLCKSTKAEGGNDGYEVATQRTFTTFADAEKYAAPIAPGREARIVVVIKPDEGDNVYQNQHGVEFLYLYEQDGVVWLVDEEGCDFGVHRESFDKYFTRSVSETPIEQRLP